jgi:hypothetical protein
MYPHTFCILHLPPPKTVLTTKPVETLTSHANHPLPSISNSISASPIPGRHLLQVYNETMHEGYHEKPSFGW